MRERAESWSDVKAALFDLDGVVTDTARVHAAAWKRLFDDLRLGHGKKVMKIGPDIDRNKGKAVQWILRELEADGVELLPVYPEELLRDENRAGPSRVEAPERPRGQIQSGHAERAR